MIEDNIKEYHGKPIKRFQSGDSIDPSFGYSMYQDYDEGDDDTIPNLLKEIIDNKQAHQLHTLVIGAWNESYDSSCQHILDFLVANKDSFQHLEAFFCGDMVSEECEISWIIQANYEAFLNSYPKLKHFGVRGGNDLVLGKVDHSNLESLLIETGGMSKAVVNSVMTAQLPALQSLKLWLGTDEYGGDSEINQFRPVLFGDQFPNLQYLGLMNCDYVDEIALTLKDATVLDRIKTLDLSMGTLSDAGAQELLHNDKLLQLAHLNLRYHFLSDAMLKQMQTKFGAKVNLADQEDEDEYDGEIYRYVEVSE